VPIFINSKFSVKAGREKTAYLLASGTCSLTLPAIQGRALKIVISNTLKSAGLPWQKFYGILEIFTTTRPDLW